MSALNALFLHKSNRPALLIYENRWSCTLRRFYSISLSTNTNLLPIPNWLSSIPNDRFKLNSDWNVTANLEWEVSCPSNRLTTESIVAFS